MPVRHRPKSYTVFAAAFIAGAAAAFGVNRILDVHLAQRKPQVECEPIFVVLRSLPQGSPVTVWDVALKDWPKAMLPASALRARDSFEGFVLRHAVREGQPLLSVQLVHGSALGGMSPAIVAGESFTSPVPAAAAVAPSTAAENDLWTPSEPIEPQSIATDPQVATAPSVVSPPAATTTDIAASDASPVAAPVRAEPTPAEPSVSESQVAPQTPAAATAPGVARETVAVPTRVAPSPEAIDVSAKRRPTPVTAGTAEMTEADVTDIATMPSVMAPAGKAGVASDRPTTGNSTRYLVVPERIALQADTSFATPRPEPPGPPSVGRPTSDTSKPPRTGQTAANAGGSTGRRSPQARSPQQQPQQQQKQQPQLPTVAAPQRTWSDMFPNVAAGLDAMSSPWQKSRSGSNQPQTGTSQPARR
ncbi:MAG: SAF domain-containing protein [Pirellulales bacterium]